MKEEGEIECCKQRNNQNIFNGKELEIDFHLCMSQSSEINKYTSLDGKHVADIKIQNPSTEREEKKKTFTNRTT